MEIEIVEPVSFFDTLPTDTVAAQPALVELFDPPMCCATGLCGPTVDQTLLTVSEMVMALQAEGITVARYQMTSHPQKFTQNAAVMQLVRAQQLAALPTTVVRGEVVKSGVYPTLVEIKAHLDGVSA